MNEKVMAATSPYDVESSVRTGWDTTYGDKIFSQRSGKKLVYDVYSRKYTSGGYQIINRDFGKGSKSYINFQGWAVLMGHKRHTATNHETYIVARKVSGGSGIGTEKVYGTIPINISATEDLEYNNQGANHIYNECPPTATNQDNELDCNMRYDNVGFNAYLPIDELFPNPAERAAWRLFIVKRVDSHIVWTNLILPFEFDNKIFNGGKFALSSGVNANRLQMIGTNVLRRKYPRQSPGDVRDELGEDRYFTTASFYTRVGSNEDETAVWYGVISSKDNNSTRWANTAYWAFGGEQATIEFIPENLPPRHISHSMTSRYQNGNDYWVQPNDNVHIRLRQYDPESGNKYQNLRLYGSGVDVRSQHDFDASSTHNNHWMTSSHITITSAAREENTAYGRVRWTVIPKTHGHTYNVMYYYQDNANNSVGYNDTGMKLRVDGVEPQLVSGTVSSYRYISGNDYWVRPNDTVTIRIRQYDPHSGNKGQNLRLYGSGVDARSQHLFDQATNHSNHWMTSSHVNISAAYREEDTSYGTVRWTVIPKTHGHNYSITYYTVDNVDNNTGSYGDVGYNLRVDGVAPTIQFRNASDTDDFTSRDWSSSRIDVRLKFSDGHSGYKRSRYAWSQSTSTPSTWSSWTTNNNYIVSQQNAGIWYLHVQAEDNCGNIVTTYIGGYKLNNPPVPDFEFTNAHSGTGTDVDPAIYYVGENVNIENKAYDPDGDNISVRYEVVLPDGNMLPNANMTQLSNGNLTFEIDDNSLSAGVWSVTQYVTDGKNEVSLTKYMFVKDLEIIGQVKHTSNWEKIHLSKQNQSYQFYSGETFLLEALVTNYPVEEVIVTMNGKLVNGSTETQILNLTEDLLSSSKYIGQIDGEPYITEKPLAEGTVTFEFEVTYQYGQKRRTVVNIEIIGNVLEALNFRKEF
ncbi:MAG TPA: hypothetical protein VEY70_13185 [Metabacillus sp.]|nr:hypothetical protein [Metabacillus sp.]